MGPQTELEVIVLGECELRKVRAPLCLDRMPIFLEGKEERGLTLYDLRQETIVYVMLIFDVWTKRKKKVSTLQMFAGNYRDSTGKSECRDFKFMGIACIPAIPVTFKTHTLISIVIFEGNLILQGYNGDSLH